MPSRRLLFCINLAVMLAASVARGQFEYFPITTNTPIFGALRGSNYVQQIFDGVQERCYSTGIAPLEIEETWTVHWGTSNEVSGALTNVVDVYADVTTTNAIGAFTYPSQSGTGTGNTYLTQNFINTMDLKIYELLDTGRFVDTRWYDGTNYNEWFTDNTGGDYPTNFPPETFPGICATEGIGFVVSTNEDARGQVTSGEAYFTRHPSLSFDRYPLSEISYNGSSWAAQQIQTFDENFYTPGSFPALIYNRGTNTTYPSVDVQLIGVAWTNLPSDGGAGGTVFTVDVQTVSAATNELELAWAGATLSIASTPAGIKRGDSIAIVWLNYDLFGDVAFYPTRAYFNERQTVLSNMVHHTWPGYSWTNAYVGTNADYANLSTTNYNQSTNYGDDCAAEADWIADQPPSVALWEWWLDGDCPYTNWNALTWFQVTDAGEAYTGADLFPRYRSDYQQWFSLQSTAAYTSAYYDYGEAFECANIYSGNSNDFTSHLYRDQRLEWTNEFARVNAAVRASGMHSGFQRHADFYAFEQITSPTNSYTLPVAMFDTKGASASSVQTSDQYVMDYTPSVSNFLEGACSDTIATNEEMLSECYWWPDIQSRTVTNQECHPSVTLYVTNQALVNFPDYMKSAAWVPSWMSGGAARDRPSASFDASWTLDAVDRGIVYKLDNSSCTMFMDVDAPSGTNYAFESYAIPWLSYTHAGGDSPTGAWTNNGGVIGTNYWDVSAGYDGAGNTDPDIPSSDWIFDYCGASNSVIPVAVPICFDSWALDPTQTNGPGDLCDGGSTNFTNLVVCADPPPGECYDVESVPTYYEWSTNFNYVSTNFYRWPLNNSATVWSNEIVVVTNSLSFSTNFWYTNEVGYVYDWIDQTNIPYATRYVVSYDKSMNADTSVVEAARTHELHPLLRHNFTGGYSRF